MSTQLSSRTPVASPSESTPTALQTASIATPTGTLNITLAPAPMVKVPFFENPTAWVPVVTLLGVIITIVASWMKTKMELNFSASQAAIERDQSREQANLERQYHADQAHQERITKARREVYLEVINEMIRAQGAIAKLPMQEVQSLDITTEMRGLIAAVSKVSILGEMKTVEMSRELLTIIHQSMFRMMCLIIPYDEDRRSAEELNTKVQTQISEIQRLDARVKFVLETKGYESELLDLVQQLKFRRADMETYGEAAIAAKKKLLARQSSYSDLMLAEAKPINEKLDEFVTCVRSELSLSTSLDTLRSSRQAMFAAAASSGKELRASLDAHADTLV